MNVIFNIMHTNFKIIKQTQVIGFIYVKLVQINLNLVPLDGFHLWIKRMTPNRPSVKSTNIWKCDLLIGFCKWHNMAKWKFVNRYKLLNHLDLKVLEWDCRWILLQDSLYYKFLISIDVNVVLNYSIVRRFIQRPLSS